MNDHSSTFDVIVIGGGASGMMAAGVAASRGLRVLLLDKNSRLGQKLAITGGGRCNITNDELDTHVLLSHFGAAGNFLFSTFAQFGVKETFTFFASQGLPLKTQARNRVFPVSEKAPDVVVALEKYLKSGGVACRMGCDVKRIAIDNGKVLSVETSQGSFSAKSYIVATGGASHPETGSTGDGFGWLKRMGHTVKAPTPTIVPLAVTDKWVKALSGVTLKGAAITFKVDGLRPLKVVGPLLFTHFGLSGPTILNSATKVADLLQAGDVTAHIDCFPQLNHKEVETNILQILDQHKNKTMLSVLRLLVPAGMTAAIPLLLPKVDFGVRVHSFSKEDRKQLVHTLKSMSCHVTGLMGFDRAVVADGGVDLNEIDMRTMRSKVIPNLYVTGDLLNINRPSGGYSLQLCWTTGFVAGTHCAKYEV